MKNIVLSENLILEISEGEEFFYFAEKVISEELYVQEFSLKETLSEILLIYNEPDVLKKEQAMRTIKDSFITLMKYNGEYIGVCCFLEFHRCTVQSFIKPDFRGKNFAYLIVSETIQLIKNLKGKKDVFLHRGNKYSYILFYKLWVNKIINLSSLIDMNDQIKLRYIKHGLIGRKLKCFLSFEDRELLDKYIISKLV